MAMKFVERRYDDRARKIAVKKEVGLVTHLEPIVRWRVFHLMVLMVLVLWQLVFDHAYRLIG
jgi:uncharacterized membrane protein YqjE